MGSHRRLDQPNDVSDIFEKLFPRAEAEGQHKLCTTVRTFVVSLDHLIERQLTCRSQSRSGLGGMIRKYYLYHAVAICYLLHHLPGLVCLTRCEGWHGHSVEACWKAWSVHRLCFVSLDLNMLAP